MIFEFLKSLPKEAAIILVSALPISELRGSIPLGLSMGMPVFKVVLLSLIGNIAIIAPILLLLEPVSNRLRRFVIWRKFFDWLFEKTKRKADIIQRYEALGLAIFVAIPLPMTGAWSGCIAASLFKIRFRYAFFAILLGVVIAAIIVTAVCILGGGLIKHIFTSSIVR